MPDKIQTYLGTLAIEKGFLTQAQLNECIEWLDKEESQNPIEEILLQKGLITKEQLDYLQKKQRVNIEKLRTRALIDYVKKMKMVTAEKLARCVELQERAYQEQKKYIPLPTLFVSHGLMSQEKTDDIVKSKMVQREVQQTIWSDDPRRTGFIGRVLGGYEIISKIASGGMGTVYRSIQIELERPIALKILFEKFAAQKKHLLQFFREARLSGIFNHPNLVHIFDMGNDQGFFYYAMELVEGKNVGDYLQEKGKLPQEEALDIITQAARGLKHVHGYGVVHRDIKPSNFMVRPDGIVKVMDLGLAQEIGKAGAKAATLGTPYYMSPELIHSPAEADDRADIYALGVSFYRLLTGKYPITGTDPKEILKNINEQIPIPVTQHEPEVSRDIERVIQKMLAKSVKDRYQNMGQVLNDLDRILLE